MASLFLRDDTWWVQYYDRGKRRRVSLNTTSKARAKREKVALEAKLLEPKRLVKDEQNALIGDFWPEYQFWASQHLEPATRALHERFWGYLMEHAQPKRLGDVTPRDLESYKTWRRSVGNSEQTVNNHLKDLQALYNRSAKMGFFTGLNPVVGVERFKVTRQLVTFHTEEQLLRLLEVVTKEDPNITEKNLEWTLLLGGWAGLRKKEIVNARWEWFHFVAKPTIRIQEFDGFRIKTREERTIPMSKRIYEALEPHRKSEGFVFESSRPGNGHYRYRFDPRKSLDRALREAELPTDDPFQRLRRTFGSIHLQNGKPLLKVSRWMGNSPKVCERHYAGLLDYDEDIDSF